MSDGTARATRTGNPTKQMNVSGTVPTLANCLGVCVCRYLPIGQNAPYHLRPQPCHGCGRFF